MIVNHAGASVRCEKGKPAVKWGRKATGPLPGGSRAAEQRGERMRSLTYHRSNRAAVTALSIAIALAMAVALGLFYFGRSAEAHHKPWHDKGNTTPPTLTCNKGEFLAQYRNELKTFNTQPVLTRCEPAINNDWGSGSPGSGVNADSFTSHWVGTFDFEASGYEFTASSDDGIRLWVDGQLLIDQWKDQAAATYKATKAMTAGEHEVRVEYYENAGLAVAKVSWAKVSSPPPDCSQSLQTLINSAAAGSTLLVPACTYRETVTVNKPLTIDGQGVASLRGSDVWSGFSQVGGNYVSSNTVPTFPIETRNICGASSDQRCKLPEQVYVDGVPQYQLAGGADPSVGQFALDGSR